MSIPVVEERDVGVFRVSMNPPIGLGVARRVPATEQG